jgi:hypothetical protein
LFDDIQGLVEFSCDPLNEAVDGQLGVASDELADYARLEGAHQQEDLFALFTASRI